MCASEFFVGENGNCACIFPARPGFCRKFRTRNFFRPSRECNDGGWVSRPPPKTWKFLAAGELICRMSVWSFQSARWSWIRIKLHTQVKGFRVWGVRVLGRGGLDFDLGGLPPAPPKTGLVLPRFWSGAEQLQYIHVQQLKSPTISSSVSWSSTYCTAYISWSSCDISHIKYSVKL